MESSCIVITGERGAGKSTTFALMSETAKKQGRDVYCQFPYEGVHMIPVVAERIKNVTRFDIDKDWLYSHEFEDGASANFCRERFCPMCQRRKALRTYAEISRLWEVMQAEYSFLHLVLTIKNVTGRELPDTINHLFKCSSKMFKMPRFKQGVKGVLRCLEVSYNADNNTYHPHLHCLCAVRKSYFTSRYYLKHEELREMWAMSIKADYSPQISVKKCGDGAIAEVAKYCVKPLALDLPTDRRARVLDVLNFVLKGRRMLQSYGVVRETARALKIDFDGDCEDLPNDGAKSLYCYDYTQNLYTEC